MVLSPRAASMALFTSDRAAVAFFQNAPRSRPRRSSTPSRGSGQPCVNTDLAARAGPSGIAACASSARCGVTGAIAATSAASTSAMTVCASRVVSLVGASAYSRSLLTSRNTLDRNAVNEKRSLTAVAYAYVSYAFPVSSMASAVLRRTYRSNAGSSSYGTASSAGRSR